MQESLNERAPEPTFRPLSRTEVGELIDWAAAEGWNPGLADADTFWAADPSAFWGMEIEGEWVGAGAIPSYGRKLGFMGLFIVRPEWRGQGLGRKLWYFRRDKLRERLDPDASILMDGVFEMQPFYASGGFVFTHRNLRMQGTGEAGKPDPRVRPLREFPIEIVEACDLRHFGASRRGFLEKWIQPSGGAGFAIPAADDPDKLRGYAVVRPCRSGFKIGPLFADDPEVAEALFRACSGVAAGEPLFLDTPEINADALALAKRHGMEEVFGCARMVLGEPPPLPWKSIYGVTTFELG